MEKTRLVASPRCGGHWVNTMIDVYMKGISINEFSFSNKNTLTCVHTHDGRLKEKYLDVIYLYRNPIDKIFSEVMYYHKNRVYTRLIHYNNNIDDRDYMKMQLGFYIEHLTKWLLEEKFTKKKTLITYDNLKNDFENEFIKICDHFEVDVIFEDISKLRNIKKKDVKKKIVGGSEFQRVVNVTEDYERKRHYFTKKHGEYIKDMFVKHGDKLKPFFQEMYA